MKILFHGPAFYCGPGLLSGYSGGHDIRRLGIDDDADFPYDPSQETMSDVLRRIGDIFSPDVVMCWFPEEHPPPMAMEDCPVATVVCVGDWDIHFAALEYNVGRFDVLLCDKAGVNILGGDYMGAHYLGPLYSHDPTVHRRHDVEKDIDVAFVGTLNPARHGRRGRYLERIAQLGGRYRVVIAEGPTGDDYARILSRARLVFNCSVRRELNLRLFESLACGAMPMLEDDNREAGDWLVDGRDVVLYNDENLDQRITEWLSIPDQSRAVTVEGPAKASELAGHKRLDALLDGAMALPKSGRPYRDLSPADQLFHSVLLYRCKSSPPYVATEDALLAEAMNRYPDDGRFHGALGNHLLNPHAPGDEATRHQQALATYTKALELTPESPHLALNGSLAADINGAMAELRAFLNQATAGDSMAASGLLFENHWDAFWCRYQSALARRKATPTLVHGEAHVQLARLAMFENRLADGQAHLDQAATLDPESPNAVRPRAELLWMMGQKEKAARALHAGLPLLPMNTEALSLLQKMYLDLGRTQEVEEIGERLRSIQRAMAAGQAGMLGETP